MRCPTCDHELKLKPAARGEIELEYCPACRGAWLTPGELDKLMDWPVVLGDWLTPGELDKPVDWPTAGAGRPDAPAEADNGGQKSWHQGIRFYDFG